MNALMVNMLTCSHRIHHILYGARGGHDWREVHFGHACSLTPSFQPIIHTWLPNKACGYRRTDTAPS